MKLMIIPKKQPEKEHFGTFENSRIFPNPGS